MRIRHSGYRLQAGGGGGGGFTDDDLFNLPLKTIDLTDGSWTLLDTDSIIKSVSFDPATGRNEITVNGLVSGSNADLNWKNSGTRNAPRWYRPAQIGSNNIRRGYFVFGSWKLDFSADRQMSIDIVSGLAISGTATNASALRLSGAFGQIAASQTNAYYGVYAYSGSTTLNTSGPDFGLVATLGGGNRIGGGVASLVKEVGGFDTNQNAGISRTSNLQMTSGGQPMQLVVGLGLRQDGTALTDGSIVRIGLSYRYIRPDLS